MVNESASACCQPFLLHVFRNVPSKVQTQRPHIHRWAVVTEAQEKLDRTIPKCTHLMQFSTTHVGVLILGGGHESKPKDTSKQRQVDMPALRSVNLGCQPTMSDRGLWPLL